MTEPNERYVKDLETVLDLAKNEFRTESLDVPNHQTGLLKTYLWLSTVLLAGEIGITNTLLEGKTVIPWIVAGAASPAFYVYAFIAISFAFAVFCLGIDGLRARVDVPAVKSFTQLADFADTDGNNKCILQKQLIKFFNQSLTDQIAENNRIGLLLRKMSRLLLASTGCFVFTVWLFVVG